MENEDKRISEQEIKNIQNLHHGPWLAYQAIVQQTLFCAQGIYMASLLGGGDRVVTTGTLTQVGPTLGQFAYSSQPQDKLIISLLNGQKLEYQILNTQGDFSGDGENFLRRNHLFEFRGGWIGQNLLQVKSQMMGGRKSAHAKGHFIHEGKKWAIDLHLEGQYFFEVDLSGMESKDDFGLKGVIASSELDTKIEVDEHQLFHIVTARSDGRNTSANSSALRKNSQLILGNGHTRYQWQDGLIKRNFKDGRPSDSNFWTAQGTLYKNGQRMGEMKFLVNNPHFLEIYLLLNNGEKIKLESWALRD